MVTILASNRQISPKYLQEAPALGFDNLFLPALIFFGGAAAALALTLAESAAAGRAPMLQRSVTAVARRRKGTAEDQWGGP